MGALPPPSPSRRLLITAAVLGLFLILDVALFGWLIFRSLSQREIERTLLETREEAEGLAAQLVGRAAEHGEDLYTAVALERETRTYIDSVLRQRDVVKTVEIFDKDGVLVFRGRSEAESMLPDPSGENRGAGPRELPPQVETKTFERQSTYEVTVPIGELGVIHIGISEGELERRIALLRGELLREAASIGGVTLAVLILAYFTIWWLWRRGRKLEEKAAEAERMAYIGTLASGLAHEIRNPLNSLNLNMQLLEEEVGEPPRGGTSRRLLAITKAEISRLERLVTDFLSYAKPRPLELAEVRAVELLEHCREVLAGRVQAGGVRLSVEDRSEGGRVRVDAGQMRQLLLNLAQNALTATEGSGRSPEIRLTAERRGGGIALEVADNGCGIAPGDRDRIFDLFYSTRKGGTGLGLAIVRRIAQAHDADLEVESAPGEGTSVRVILPAVPAPREAAVPDAPLEPSLNR